MGGCLDLHFYRNMGEAMKLAIIKAIISWLWRNHKFLLMETVVPEGHHIHKNPPGKPHAKYSDLIPLVDVREQYQNPAVSGTDE